MNSKGLEQSAVQQRIDAQCTAYLHKPTNKRYRIAASDEGVKEMHCTSGGGPVLVRFVKHAELSNTEIWSKQP